MLRKKVKVRHLVILFLLISLLMPFVLWFSAPSKYLNIVIVNKTFPTDMTSDGKIDKLEYSKQQGLFWLIDYLGIKNPATKTAYNVNEDYYGNFLENGQLVNKPLEKLTDIPDLIILSDMYGTGNAKMNGEEAQGISGLTQDEVGLISTYYTKGTTVIGEYNIAGNPTVSSVAKELEEIFGASFTGLAGKFFSDLSSIEDVPNWIREIYEQQFGKKWKMDGAGIVIAGNNRIAVLQRDIGFIGNSIQIEISDEQDHNYGTETTDFYNWFEIIEPAAKAKIIASYQLNLTEEGRKQLEPFGLSDQFPAIILNESKEQKSYYFAGDFTDYREPKKNNRFLGATTLYKYFSVKSEGELSYFYWHFYVPFMTEVIKNIEPLDQHATNDMMETDQDGSRLVSKIVDKQIEVYRNGSWNALYINGVNIGTTVPGILDSSLPNDPAFYLDWFEQIGDMNANVIRINKLMPSVFYRALDNYNYNHSDYPLYILQNINVDERPLSGNFFDQEYQAAFRQAVTDTINAMHGNAVIAKPNTDQTDLYRNDVSSYVIGYMVDPRLSLYNAIATDTNNRNFHYEGEYVTTAENASPTEAWLALISDYIYAYEQASYQMQHPVAIVSNPELEMIYQTNYAPIADVEHTSVDINRINITNKVTSGFFGAYNIFPNEPSLAPGTDAEFSEYSTYINSLTQAQTKYPVLISEFGLPTSGDITEAQQAEGLATLIKVIKNSGAMGGVVYQWADEWGKKSTVTASTMTPNDRGMLWHNIVEPAQNYGIVSLESLLPTDYSMNLRGSGQLNEFSLTADESYFYIRADMNKLPDFNKQKIMLYLDTIDRKNGEYMLAPDVTENWSGVEFNITIESQNKAEILVIPSYNANKGSYYPTISTNGIFERMENLISPEYLTKSGQKIAAIYEDQSKLVAGSFENRDSQFYFEESTLYMRIPWARLNFTDPSSLLVLYDEDSTGLHKDSKDMLAVKMTDGIVTSLVIMNKENNQVDYQFPESVTSSGYRTFTWNTWDVPRVVSRNKLSYETIKKAFANNNIGSYEGSE